ncbi:MAG: archaemetzincin family Zn-dependent metalloprotease [Candidatus Omnitrophica bacterium]|nr:archaemetzincin family Zn-dependent metalloprotease [Candidatus Omnitrophota bacterium]
MQIFLAPIGPIRDICETSVKEELSAVFPADVVVMPGCPVPAGALNSQRGQVYAKTVLKDLVACTPLFAPDQRALGIIDQDIYVEGFDFLFGLADRKTGYGLVSVVRLRPEFYGQPADNTLFCRRVVKEAVHEIGHTFGLSHCSRPQCVMYFSEFLEDTDRKGSRLCVSCRKKLSS